VDGDGLEDLYWCRPGGLPNRLLLHQADGRVRDASAASGVDLLDYSSSALLLDLDGDVDLDLAVGTGSGLVFFANDGRGRFERALFLERSLPTSLAAADPDADGDLDLYVCSYVSPYERDGTPLPYHAAENGEANWLLRNDGEWRLVEVSAELGLDANNQRFSLAAGWEDFDADGDADLYVANDFGKNNLYRNDGGRFRDVAEELGALDISAGMGVAWGDVDEDGWPDLYVTNLHSPAGRRLTARPDFRPAPRGEATTASTRTATPCCSREGRPPPRRERSSGTRARALGLGLDLRPDLDGALDLFAPDGFVTGARRDDLASFFWREVVLRSPEAGGEPGEDYSLGWRAVNRLVRQGWSWNGHERDVAFLNLGRGTFADVSAVTGLDLSDDARAAVRVDWDGDGDEDLIVANRTGPMLRFLRNEQTSANRWIEFTLRSKSRTPVGASSRDELGAPPPAFLALREGYPAQSSARLCFGLAGDGVASVTVRWPGGESEAFGSPAPGSAHLLEQGTGRAVALPARERSARLHTCKTEDAAGSSATRTVLATPLPLPRLALETADGRATSLLGITMQGPRGTGKPLLLALWSSAAPGSRRALERFARAARPLADAGVQILALSPSEGEDHPAALAALTEIGWPFAHGFASEEALQILELVEAALHDDARALALPSGFLIDPGGQLEATYEGELDAERVRADLALFDLERSARRDACVPFPGRWIAPVPEPFDERVAARLAAQGLEGAAAEYRVARVEVRELSAAKRAYEQGAPPAPPGSLPEAVALSQGARARPGLRDRRPGPRRRAAPAGRARRGAQGLRARPRPRARSRAHALQPRRPVPRARRRRGGEAAALGPAGTEERTRGRARRAHPGEREAVITACCRRA
jgi:hypothetical protein